MPTIRATPTVPTCRARATRTAIFDRSDPRPLKRRSWQTANQHFQFAPGADRSLRRRPEQESHRPHGLLALRTNDGSGRVVERLERLSTRKAGKMLLVVAVLEVDRSHDSGLTKQSGARALAWIPSDRALRSGFGVNSPGPRSHGYFWALVRRSASARSAFAFFSSPMAR
jgi:hypothetical protein